MWFAERSYFHSSDCLLQLDVQYNVEDFMSQIRITNVHIYKVNKECDQFASRTDISKISKFESL